MIDYTMDIRMRLNLGDEMPVELAQRKQKVLNTLIELQGEVEPITKATELLKDTDIIKDSKTFVAELTRNHHNVSNIVMVNVASALLILMVCCACISVPTRLGG